MEVRTVPADSHVFISYARKDGRVYAERLDSALSATGLPTWRDVRDIDPTQDFSAEIETAIEAASFVVTCITSDVRRSDSFVRREIGYALTVDRPVLVVRFEDVVPPVAVVNHTRIDLFSEWDPGFGRLCSILQHPLDYRPARKAPEARQDPRRPYLEGLYREIVRYLKITVFSALGGRGDTPVLAVAATEEPQAVSARTMSVLPRAFFDQAGIGEKGSEAVYGNLEEAFYDNNERLLVLGEPGSGKTVSLMAFARDAIARRFEDLGQPLPIVAPISQWDPYVRPGIAQWLAALIPALAPCIGEIIQDGQALLLFDGLDELGEKRKDPTTNEEYDPRQRFLQVLPENNKVLLTCRAKDYASIGQKAGLAGAVVLRPLDDLQIERYLRNVPELWNALRKRADLRDVLRIPLLLSRFAAAFCGLPEAVMHLGELETGAVRDAILERFFQSRFEHERRRPHGQPAFTLGELYVHLGKFVAQVEPYFQGGGIWSAPETFTVQSLGEWLGIENASELAELAVRLNIFIAADGNRYRFVHLLIRDHFAFNIAQRFFREGQRTRTRAGALLMLRELRDPRALPLFLAALTDSSQPVRWHAVTGLKELADTRAVEPLIEKLNDRAQPGLGDAYDQTPPAYWVASEALDRIGEPAVLPLIAALRNKDVQIRGSAADILGRIEDKRALAPLKKLLAEAGTPQTVAIQWREVPFKDVITQALANLEGKPRNIKRRVLARNARAG